jgi:hypothetical protein
LAIPGAGDEDARHGGIDHAYLALSAALVLVDENTGKDLKRFDFASPVRLAHLVSGKDKTLLVLTADQALHRIPLLAADIPPKPAAVFSFQMLSRTESG